jgi:predicted nucleic-acid-binding protein
MVAVDTNVIVRFLTRDHESQYRKALSVFRDRQVFIPDTVILETEWVLRYAYEFDPQAICNAFERLFGLDNVRIAHPHSVAQAIEWHRNGIDFSDAMHLAFGEECDALYSLDAGFIKAAKGRSKCQVTRP